MAENVELSAVEHLANCRHFVGKSRYRIERYFDALGEEERGVILQLANLSDEDVLDPFRPVSRLRHLSETGIRKLIEAHKLIRQLNQKMPACMRPAEFYFIDQSIS